MANWLPIPYRVVILGGGIAGLSAAHSILKFSNIPCHVTIVEQQNRIGGWVQSRRLEDGTVYEQGPRGVRAYGFQALETLKLVSSGNNIQFDISLILDKT